MSKTFRTGSSLLDVEMVNDPMVRSFDQEPSFKIRHVDRRRVEGHSDPEESTIPDYIGEGIEHFEAHPSVDGPVEYRRTTGTTAFRVNVRDGFGGETLVQESGQTPEVAWRHFEDVMSNVITRTAVEGRSGGPSCTM
jgi:hypothetical protein